MENEIAFEKERELITFKGLPVSHRFTTPAKELETTHNEDNLKELYAKIKAKVATKKGLSYKTTEEALPDPEAIVAGVEMVIEQFPYSNIEEEEILDYSQLDSIQIAKIEEAFQLKQDEEANEHWEMIKNDFPTLTEQEIADNMDLIDEYYSQNLDYVALEAVASEEDEIMAKIGTTKLYKNSDTSEDSNCLTQNFQILFGFNPAKSLYAADKAKEIAEEAVKHYYTSSKGVPITGSNSVNNTYKHMVFSAFLAQKYFTISNKRNRLNFAETVGDRHEYCNPNEDDGREMDFHNNAIGRTIWDDNTSYRKFLGTTTGLKKPSDAKLREEIRKRIDRSACFIVKKKENRFPENRRTRDLSIPEVVSKIQSTSAHIPVYFDGPIKQPTYRYVRESAGFETVPCTGGNLGSPFTPNGQCQKEVFKNVRKEVPGCFKL